MLIQDFKIDISQSEVFRQIDCYEDSAVYDDVLKAYEEIEESIYELCEPVFLVEKDIIEQEYACDVLPAGTEVLFTLCSIGEKISGYSTKAFEEGEYLKGMLADAMADSALFSIEKAMVPYLKELCASEGMGIEKRLEAPKDIPMEMQKVVLEKTHAEGFCGMGITSCYMLNPVKTSAFIYVLTDDKEVFQYQHDCKTCDRYDCKMRKVPDIPVTVIDGTRKFVIQVKERQNLLDALMAVKPSFSSVCGGTGTCGKCKVQVVKGTLPVTVSDETCFTKAELEAGMRLACRANPVDYATKHSEPLEIRLLLQSEETFVALGDENKECYLQNDSSTSDLSKTFGIAVDLGTTTIAIQLLSLQTGEVHGVYTCVNHQRRFGADVISRIKASTEGNKEELRKSIQDDLKRGFREVLKKASVLPTQITDIVIAGNTTMGHLLMGYDCNTLGVFPFTPVNIMLIEESYQTIFEDDFLNARVKILPGISAFIGADITSGIYYCNMHKSQKYSLLIDLGTNGEIVLGNAEKLFATSTAAGPAFEGGNIKWGIGSVEGAISSAVFVNGKLEVQTIGSKTPIGICGTGVLEMTAELLGAGLIDKAGCLNEEYFEDDYPVARTENGELIVFTQKDIRELQMAKSAVRAGVEMLIQKSGIREEDIAHIYLAGGFGVKLNYKKAIKIGLLSKGFENKVEAVGNSSLQGTARILLAGNYQELEDIVQRTEEINLAMENDFNQLYLENMYFK